ncbi:hypothetical protein Mapa_013031 [Marchantia paleacea]|nr:hypothetical protein Mapa_013031 [Marchantia paleacea]
MTFIHLFEKVAREWMHRCTSVVGRAKNFKGVDACCHKIHIFIRRSSRHGLVNVPGARAKEHSVPLRVQDELCTEKPKSCMLSASRKYASHDNHHHTTKHEANFAQGEALSMTNISLHHFVKVGDSQQGLF